MDSVGRGPVAAGARTRVPDDRAPQRLPGPDVRPTAPTHVAMTAVPPARGWERDVVASGEGSRP